MDGVQFKDQTMHIGKPANMTEDECYALPIKVTKNGNYPSIESVWELSEEELKMINESKRIRVGILGTTMAPMYINAEIPNNTYEDL